MDTNVIFVAEIYWINYIKFVPQGANSYGPSETIEVKLSSNTDFMVLDRSYIKFTLSTSATGILSVNGGSACINSISDNVGFIFGQNIGSYPKTI